jgi:hypothetical protein
MHLCTCTYVHAYQTQKYLRTYFSLHNTLTNRWLGPRLLNLQLQRQRYSRLQCFLKVEDSIFAFRTHEVTRGGVNFYSAGVVTRDCRFASWIPRYGIRIVMNDSVMSLLWSLCCKKCLIYVNLFAHFYDRTVTISETRVCQNSPSSWHRDSCLTVCITN